MAKSERLRGVRIVVVEDNDDARDLLTMAFARDGAEVASAENGAAAIPILYAKRPHVVVTDLSMPLMDGYEVLKATREILPGVPCIAVTAFALEHDRQAAIGAGFDAHVPKPVEYQTLIAGIVDLLASPPRSSGEVARPMTGVRPTPRRRARKTG